MPPHDLVPNGPIREAFLRLQAQGEINAQELALRLGWMKSPAYKPDSGNLKHADYSRVSRRLGLVDSVTVKPKKTYRGRQQHISYDIAVQIVRAMHMDPVDFDL